MLIDAIARTYGCLPSQVLANGDSFDLMVLDVSTTWQTLQNSKQQGKVIPNNLLNEQDLQQQINRVRNGN